MNNEWSFAEQDAFRRSQLLICLTAGAVRLLTPRERYRLRKAVTKMFKARFAHAITKSIRERSSSGGYLEGEWFP